MQIAYTRDQLHAFIEEWRRDERSYAFVPTMGALHDGHLTLVRRALEDFPRVVVSIFVNPTQFDREEDLARYPRQPEQDAAVLRGAGAHVLFMPCVDEIYPAGLEAHRQPELEGLDKVFEGAMRPGHFEGVVQVVRRLVQLVSPQAMYMGQKDAQQVAVLQRARAQEFWPLHIVSVPIVRETSGLAMSSRNGRLSTKGFAKAALIHACLRESACRWRHGEPISELEACAKTRLTFAGFRPEYFAFVDPRDFTPLPDLPHKERPTQTGLIVVVAWIEGVRLIDNYGV